MYGRAIIYFAFSQILMYTATAGENEYIVSFWSDFMDVYKYQEPLTFGEIIVTERKVLGYSQEQLAKLIGTNKQMVCKYECKQRNVPREKIELLLNVFGIEKKLYRAFDIEKGAGWP